jgi:hypothetical protein
LLDLASLAAILTGDDQHLVACFHVHNSTSIPTAGHAAQYSIVPEHLSNLKFTALQVPAR